MEINFPTDDELKTVFQMKRFIILPVITILLVVGIVIFVIVPNVQKISQMSKEKVAMADKLNGLNRKVEVLSSFDEDVLVEQVNALEDVLPSKKAVLEWIYSINSLASETEVSFGKFSLKPGSIATQEATPAAIPKAQKKETKETERRGRASVKKAQTFRLSLEVVGSFASIKEFFSGLDKLAPIMRMTTLELTSLTRRRISVETGEIVEAEQAKANLNVMLFYAPLPEEMTGIGEAVRALGEKELELYEELLSYKTYKLSSDVGTTIGRDDIFAPF